MDRIQPGSKNDGLVRKERRDNMMGRPPIQKRHKTSINKTYEEKSSETIHPSWAAKQKQKGIDNFAGKKISFGKDSSPKPDEKIHPSWAAKQKQKGIGGFAGTKISFADDGEDSSPKQDEKMHTSWAAKQDQKGKPPFKKTFEEKKLISLEKIHPSWAAKQKQKGIDAFAGKKISFGEDGEDSSSKSSPYNGKVHSIGKKNTNPDEKIHPSWLAKQKLKPVISSFQGKKISFGNDD